MSIIIKTKDRIKAISFFTITFLLSSLIFYFINEKSKEKLIDINLQSYKYLKEEIEFKKFFKQDKILRKSFNDKNISIVHIDKNLIYFDYTKNYSSEICKEKETLYFSREEKIFYEIEMLKQSKYKCSFIFKDNNI